MIRSRRVWPMGILLLSVWLGGCTLTPLVPFSTATPPLLLAPASTAGLVDQRGRFREIFCALNEHEGAHWPDHRPCEEALVRLEAEPPPTGQPVELGKDAAAVTLVGVLGLGGNCVDNFLRPEASMPQHLQSRGFRFRQIEVNGLSSSEENAVRIRDALLEREDLRGDEPLVLMGYSKGIVDILVALATYPEIQDRVDAVVSVSGAVGGSPLANEAPDWLVRLFQLAPGSTCEEGDLRALESLRTGPRRRWLAENPLPRNVRYYSVVTFPEPGRISNGLRKSYDTLSQVDARNDSQLIFYDQVIPGSRLLAYVNADHLAIVLPIERSHPWLAALAMDHNDYPREVLVEAILRHVQEDLAGGAKE